MIALQPYDDPALLAICTPTAANLEKYFPCIKALWHSDDYDADTYTITDRVGGISMISAGTPAGSVSDSGGVRLGATTDITITLSAGLDLSAYVNIGMIHSGIMDGMTFGVITYPYMNLRAKNAVAYPFAGIDGDNDYLVSVAPASDRSTVQSINGLGVDITAQTFVWAIGKADGSSTQIVANDTPVGTVATTDAVLGAGAILTGAAGSTGARRTKMFAILGCTASLNDMEAATRWMIANPGYLYPGFIGRE